MDGGRWGFGRRGGRGRPLGGRRVPAARSLAPTLLNGFLGLAVYLSFVFASVAQLPHRTLTATSWLLRSARRELLDVRPRARPRRAQPRARAPGWARGRAPGTRVPGPASSALRRQNGSGMAGMGAGVPASPRNPPWASRCSWSPSAQSYAGPAGPSGTREMLGAHSRGDPSPRAFTPFSSRGAALWPEQGISMNLFPDRTSF